MTQKHRQTAKYILRSRIIRGELPGGAKLRASHLADEMGVSRTPISEALLALEAEGLLIGDKSGYTVRSFTIEDVFTAIDLRGLLEAAAVQHAAEKGVPDGRLDDLRALNAEIEGVIQIKKYEAYDDLNDRFHQAMITACENPLLIEEVERCYRLPFAGPSSFPSRDRPSRSFETSLLLGQVHHSAIIEAISLREGARAFSLVREHARLAHANVREALKTDRGAPQLALVSG